MHPLFDGNFNPLRGYGTSDGQNTEDAQKGAGAQASISTPPLSKKRTQDEMASQGTSIAKSMLFSVLLDRASMPRGVCSSCHSSNVAKVSRRLASQSSGHSFSNFAWLSCIMSCKLLARRDRSIGGAIGDAPAGKSYFKHQHTIPE